MFVECQRWWFQWRFAAILVNCAPSGEMHNYCKPHIIKENVENFLIHRCNYIFLSQVYCVWQVVKTPTIIFNNPVQHFCSLPLLRVIVTRAPHTLSCTKQLVSLLGNYSYIPFNKSHHSRLYAIRDFDSKFVNISHKITEDFRPTCRISPHLSIRFTIDQLHILSGETLELIYLKRVYLKVYNRSFEIFNCFSLISSYRIQKTVCVNYDNCFFGLRSYLADGSLNEKTNRFVNGVIRDAVHWFCQAVLRFQHVIPFQ